MTRLYETALTALLLLLVVPWLILWAVAGLLDRIQYGREDEGFILDPERQDTLA